MNMSLRIVLALFSGILLIISFPRFDLSFAVWIALVPLLLALRGQAVIRSFGLGFLTGLAFIIGVFYWITQPASVLIPDFLLMVSYLALYVALFGAMLTFFSHRAPFLPMWLTAPVLWVSCEYLRSNFFFLEFPWALLGHTQHTHLALIQIAAFTGAYGVSFLIVMANVAVFELIHRRDQSLVPLTAAFALVGLTMTYGAYALSLSPQNGSLPVTVVQGDVPQDIRWDREFRDSTLAYHGELTKRAMQGHPGALVVWPETSVPGGLRRDATAMMTLASLARDLDASLLVGTAERAKFKPKEQDPAKTNRYNNASLIAPTGRIVQNYRKIKLMPFGEYLPASPLWAWPSRYASNAGHFIAGDQFTVFRLPSLDGETTLFSVMICWETIFPGLAREFVRGGAMFLVAMSNEAYFRESAALEQFLSMNVFRAVENRRSVVRSVNAGISCVIDPFGRIIKVMDQDEAGRFIGGSFTQDVSLVQDLTFYTRYGDLFAQFLTMGAGLALGLSCVRRPRQALVATRCG